MFFFHQFACNHQLIFDCSQTMTSQADIKVKFYNLLAEKKLAKQGKKVVALTSAVYHEITTSLAVINSGTNSAWIYHFWARYCPYFNFVDYYPIMISKIVLKSVLWRGSESTSTFCIFQLLCNLHLYHQHEQHDGNHWAPARGSLNGWLIIVK